MSTIREYRKRHGLSQKALAELCHVDQTSVSKWELGKSYPDVDVAMTLSSYFSVPLDLIYENSLTFGLLSLPVYNHLHPEHLHPEHFAFNPGSFGEHWEVSQNRLRMYFSNEELLSGKTNLENLADYFFVMKIAGKAMESRFCEGDHVLVKKQPHVLTDQVAAVCIDAEEARLYQIKWHKKGVVLHSLNNTFEPLFYTKSEYDSGSVRILGRVIELRAIII